ncbi:glutamyl-tRNA amidotransferase [Candidatus Falkowbacteria bacterium CG10_big_fil_rev_8_21_14_0_10_43_10]|uniref:Glutamyl-tRNA amidotransferase n=1 Tax=Candidatus Falkowbacteria bacterium CG10_big_fil_rev_8_21_14_0_10_43_10 TaxID=1974567 RepID=A0A2H0V1M0_9BACT|nr:MAG: glutamyl-tRNA amidotransferase [Candidatus Falkowbacteria bacterium CG10_big_fil_rev_8_21_14_0_10_43_10]
MKVIKFVKFIKSLFSLSFPRRRESHEQHVNVGIPAFAGMTVKNMATKQQILDDFTAAFKARDEAKKRTLSSIKSEILVFEKSPAFAKVAAGKADGSKVDSQKLTEILKSMAKKRRESIEAFEQGNRPELAVKEKEELEIIESYLPEQISEEQVRKVIKEIVETNGYASQDFGRAMGMAMGELKGKADGNIVSKVLKEILGQS